MFRHAPGTIDRIDSSTENVDTALLRLSPEFLEALRKIAPKKRRVKMRNIVGLTILATMTVLGADRSARELIAARWHRAPTFTVTAADGATAFPVIEQPVVTTVESVENRIVPVVSPAPTRSPPAPAARKSNQRTGPRAAPKPARR